MFGIFFDDEWNFCTVMESLKQVDHLVLQLQQLFSVILLHRTQQLLCGQLPNVMLLYNMVVKFSRHCKAVMSMFCF